MTRRNLLTAALAAAATFALAPLGGGVAQADISKAVIGHFRGQLVITKGELPEGKTDKDTIAKIKSAKLSELTGTAGDEVTAWTFHYAAFLTKAGASSLKLEFWRDGKQYSADKRLSGADPKSPMLTGEITIDEDENITKGKSYVIKLVTEGNKTVAQTTLLMK